MCHGSDLHQLGCLNVLYPQTPTTRYHQPLALSRPSCRFCLSLRHQCCYRFCWMNTSQQLSNAQIIAATNKVRFLVVDGSVVNWCAGCINDRARCWVRYLYLMVVSSQCQRTIEVQHVSANVIDASFTSLLTCLVMDVRCQTIEIWRGVDDFVAPARVTSRRVRPGTRTKVTA